tara:strand:- start:2130 stop:2672 length:543 start_codon:yes stop_codon:yes gene_type:complete
MRLLLITLSLSVLCISQALAQHHGTAIIHEPAFRYTITAPNGWVYDEVMAKEMRLNMVFYPDTTKWTKSPIVMYVNTTLKLDSSQTLEDVAEIDIKNFSGDSPGVKAEYQKTLSTYPQGMEAIVYSFKNSEKNNFEWVAYIEHEYYVLMLVMGTRKIALYEANESIFDRLVISYFDLNRD